MSVSEVRLVDVDSALADDFLAYARVFGAQHDDSYVTPEDLASFDPSLEPATVAVDENGTVVGAASAMLTGYLDEGISRFRILHAHDAHYYPALLDRILSRLPQAAGKAFLFVPERAGDVEDALTGAGFEVSRRAYILRHLDPRNAPAAEFPSEVRLEEATPVVAADWARVINAAFHGQPGRYDMTHERAAELLARPRVIGGATLLAHRGGVPVGLVLTVSDAEDPCTAEIETLAVTPAEQGRGLGRALLLTATVAAARHGCRSVSLSVSTFNRRAVALYLNSGFHAEDIRVCWQVRRSA